MASKYPKIKLIPAKIEDHRCVWFWYALDVDTAFKFSILSECRDDVASMFRELLEKRDLGYEEVNVNVKPWVITRVWRKTLTPTQRRLLTLIDQRRGWKMHSSDWVWVSQSLTQAYVDSLTLKKYVELDASGKSVISSLGRDYLLNHAGS